MRYHATDGSCLKALVELAIPICHQAEREHPRIGPGRRPDVPDWAIAVLIIVATMKQRRTKSAQYRHITAHRRCLMKWIKIDHWPSRTTYFDRYQRAWKLYSEAIRLAGLHAIGIRLIKAECVSVDQSVVNCRGPKWNKKHLARNCLPRAADLEATWTFSKHHHWTLGYSFEVVVTSEKTGPVWPLLASVDPAKAQPPKTFPPKIRQLPESTRYVLADSGYDSNKLADAVESSKTGTRRLLCPYPKHRSGTSSSNHRETRKRRENRRRRAARKAFFDRPFARKLFRRRSQKVEPFNEWLKSRFGLLDRAWHYGLANNQTQIMASIFSYQILLLYNASVGKKNGQIQWILDTL